MTKKLIIRKNGDPVLRVKASKIKDPLDPKIQALIVSMFEAMRAENGVGLAAPQIGESLRMFIVEENGTEYVFINPNITAKSKAKVNSEEGCLSFPGQFFPISRHEKVQVRYLDITGKDCKIKASGLLARAIQHENDHLDGILIIDRLPKKLKSLLKQKITHGKK